MFAGSRSLLYRVASVAGQQTQGADKYMSDVFENLGMTMSAQQLTFWSQRQKKRTNDAEYKKKPTRKRKQSETIHSTGFEIVKQEETDKKRGRTYKSGIAVTVDAEGSDQPPTSKKCKHCGLTDHLRRPSARCPYNNSKTQSTSLLILKLYMKLLVILILLMHLIWDMWFKCSWRVFTRPGYSSQSRACE